MNFFFGWSDLIISFSGRHFISARYVVGDDAGRHIVIGKIRGKSRLAQPKCCGTSRLFVLGTIRIVC